MGGFERGAEERWEGYRVDRLPPDRQMVRVAGRKKALREERRYNRRG